MEQKDSLETLFKSAAEKQEVQNFEAKELVWNRIESKLDSVVFKKQNQTWKKLAIAASFILVGLAGYQLIQNNKIEKIQNPIVTKKEIIKSDNAIIASTGVIKKEGEKNPNINYKKVEKVVSEPNNSEKVLGYLDVNQDSKSNKKEETDLLSNTNSMSKSKSKTTFKNRIYESVGVTNAPQMSEIAEDKSAKSTQDDVKKTEPLYVLDEEAQSAKQVRNKNLTTDNNLEEEFDEIIELKEPLYIINGTYYFENELFGTNPTSPYYPLNKQKIETISILQPDVAVPIYGKKGEKGVVIIYTKNGKPAVISKKE